MNLNLVRCLVDEVACPPYDFEVREHGPLACIYAKLWRKDTTTDEESWGESSPYLIVPEMHPDVIVKRCFVAARDYSEHEIREAFTWRGKRVLGPHVPLEAMWQAL